MIIDIHTHAFPQRIAQSAVQSLQRNSHIALYSDGTREGLSASEKRAGVDLAVVQPVATNPDKVPRLNDSVIEYNKDASETGLLSFGAMHPACPCWEQELERLRQAGVPGVKLHPPYAGIAIDDARSVAILRKCKALDLIVLVHSGRDVGLPTAAEALPAKIRHALDAVGPMRFIAAHMGGWGCWDDTKALLADTGIYLDTSFSLGLLVPADDGHPWKKEDLRLLENDAFCALSDCFGADRILFGTDSPWADPKQEIRKIKELPLHPADIRRILGENANRLLHGASAEERGPAL